ncbi:nitrous oxide reductase family maturation protein NosD [Streptacidiphilus sp. MAP12-16]|uniref:right-handed parallel beta-helix repeat-containing protein n=1 Tax=Streptacidiphilus sp. MAP12-16 TaxID=3156300 RepID=UPI003516EBB9
MPTRRRVHYLAPVAVSIVLGLGAAPPVHAASWHVVHIGESIQHAVDSAKPGDTILLLPGTYHESVLVTVSDLTIRGAGSESVITPAAAVGASENACAKAGHGICVTGTASHRVADVRIESLTVSGFAKNGISGSETDRMSVSDVLVEDNGEQGISQEKSTRGLLVGNTARRNGQAGIFLANIAYGKGGAIDTEGAVIRGNDLSGNRIGAVVRRARNLTVEHNTIVGNCGGVFIVGDDGTPRAGALTVRRNKVIANNKYCPPNDRLPYIQGSGIVLTGVEDTLVTQNKVNHNVGASPLSGGIVLFHSFVGGPSSGNTISDNVAVGNGPADLVDRDTGIGNTFAGNDCRLSEPAGRC